MSQFRLRNLIVGVAICAVVLTCVLFVKRIIDAPNDAYRNWGMSDLIIAYMNENDGEWPQSWDDLKPVCIELRRSGRMSGWDDIESLEQTVNIDFNFDPVAASSAITSRTLKPDFRVIWLKNGSTASFNGNEPNLRVLNYLKARKFGWDPGSPPGATP